MSKNKNTPQRDETEEVVYPYNPRVLQDLQDIVAGRRTAEYEDRERAFVEALSPEQQKERAAYNNAIQRKKDALGIVADADVKWSEPDTPTRWAKIFEVSSQTFKRWVKKGKIRAKMLSDRRYQVDVRDIPKGD